MLALYPAHQDTLPSLVASRVAVAGEASALQFAMRNWRYGDLQRASERLAAGLAARGISKGSRLALIAANSDLSVVLFLAAAKLAAIFIPINPELTIPELDYILRHARADLVCAPEARLSSIAAGRAAAAAALQCVALEVVGVNEPAVSGILARIDAFAPAAREPADCGVDPDDPLVVIYTSGTTGFPKGVVHSHRNYVWAAEAFVERMHLQAHDRLLAVLPFYHINALFYSLGGALAAGASLITTASFSASRFWHFAAETGATQFNILAAVGTILSKRPRSEFNPAQRLRKIYGGPISAEMFAAFREEFHVPVLIEGYGMSEIPGACNNPYDGPQKIGSIGKPALHPRLPGTFVEMRIEDDAGRVLPAGQTGELVVRTPIRFQGYLDDPAQTDAAFRDGWFLTGDLARVDADGYFHFVARKKDIIRRRGENISGAELDRVLTNHPDIAEAAAIGVPSELGEEEILAVLVARAGRTPSPGEVLDWCRERLAPMKIPRFVVFVEALPHTPSQRVAKHRLKDDASLLARAFDRGNAGTAD